MRPFIALATLAATATFIYAHRPDGTMGGNSVAYSPVPGDKPSQDPSSGFAGFVAQGAVPRRNCPPSAHDPVPGQTDQQRTFRPDCVDIFNLDGYRLAVGGKSLADTLTLDRRGRVWWDYARESDSVVCGICAD